MMFKKIKATSSNIKVKAKPIAGETIETKIDRIVNNKEPITDNAELIYAERKDGIQPAYDIRTDRIEVALDAMDYATKTHIAKREERAKAGTDTKDSATTDTKTVEGGVNP